MHHPPLPDTFTLRILLTVEIVLELMDNRFSGQSGKDGAMTRAALDAAVKDTFDTQGSFDMVDKCCVIRSAKVERADNGTYVILCFVKRQEMIPIT